MQNCMTVTDSQASYSLLVIFLCSENNKKFMISKTYIFLAKMKVKGEF